ncbi:MAG: DUF2442 domain-containing protein [Ruminococcus sp.]|nr:DUF2442 domain-containing protein [Ruminococcus sp.]MCM1382352.1 DUF2442 domain-containing protein [Muribaculaceae bacterium]MCM1478528.1 DUF2442 domain-containing protein [Muribaculaceae bacterium]
MKVKAVYPYENLNIIVIFENDTAKKYDTKQLFSQFEWYKELEDPDIFSLVQVETGGYGVCWNGDIDISEDELWENSEPLVSVFDGLMSFGDAARRWGLDDSTLRKAVQAGKIAENTDAKKFGKQWIITEEAMYRIFGAPKAGS